LRVLTRFNVGGPARQALALQPEMDRLGVKTLLVGGTVQDGESDLANLLGFEDVVRLPRLGRRLAPEDDARVVASLYRMMRTWKPHVVHTHMAKAGTVGRVAGALARVPVRVHTFHGHTLHGYFGTIGTRSVILAERALARLSTELVAVSAQVRDDLLAAGVGRPQRFRVMGAGLDLEPYLIPSAGASDLRVALGIPSEARVVGMAGRLVPVKGISVFLSAIDPILSIRPGVHVLVAGDGPDRRLLSDVGARPGNQARIHALGWVTEMADFYRAVDVMVLSSHNEGTPLALIEAAASGVPAVATRVGGVPEVVVEGATGLLVPPNDPARLQEAVLRLVDDPTTSRRMGAAAREGAQRFAAARLATDLVTLYRQLLAGPARH
jgi:glycosyltransferase involved in cell wall biosynthesis